jgi:hypothetical protein
MEHRARTRILRRVGISAALAALLVPAATAGTAAAKSKPAAPVITSISPRSLAIGDTLTIRGHHFRRGRNKNTVAFKRSGGAAVFVKAAKGTTRMLKVTLPDRLEKALVSRNGVTVPTKLRLRVLSKRFGKRFSAGKRVPLISPPRPEGSTDAPVASRPDGDCDGDGQLNAADGDDDNDLLSDADEAKFGLDPCKADTDGDGVTDGYELRSARDLNDDDYQSSPNEYLPYPGTRPYPNPLDPADGNTDFDGDSLTLTEEFDLWRFTIEHEGAPVPANINRLEYNDADRLTYSDGEQYSLSSRGPDGRRVPTMDVASYTKHTDFVNWLSGRRYRFVMLVVRPVDDWNSGAISTKSFGIFDTNLDGETGTEVNVTADLDNDQYISDDERDEDADGLSNYDEAHGRMLPQYWASCYDEETPYGISYAGTSLVDGDSDGDGILDGADDQDHDDIPNIMELSRSDASRVGGIGLYDAKGGIECMEPVVPPGTPTPVQRHADRYGRVNPYNPCMPAIWSRTCERHHDINGDSAPFDESANWYSLN